MEETDIINKETTEVTKDNYKPKSRRKNTDNVFETQSHLSAVKKIPLKILKQAKRQGAPGFVGHRIDWALFEPWYIENRSKLVADAEDTLIEWKTRLTKANALTAELDLEQLKEKYLLKEDVESRFRAIAQAQKAILKSRLIQEVPQKVLGMTVPEIAVEMEKVVTEICSLMQNLEVK